MCLSPPPPPPWGRCWLPWASWPSFRLCLMVTRLGRTHIWRQEEEAMPPRAVKGRPTPAVQLPPVVLSFGPPPAQPGASGAVQCRSNQNWWVNCWWWSCLRSTPRLRHLGCVGKDAVSKQSHTIYQCPKLLREKTWLTNGHCSQAVFIRWNTYTTQQRLQSTKTKWKDYKTKYCTRQSFLSKYTDQATRYWPMVMMSANRPDSSRRPSLRTRR